MPPKAKNMGALGKAIIRDRFKGRRPVEGDTTTIRHTTDIDDGPSWTKLHSVTQEGDLDAFLRTAELAGTEFTAERLNVKIISTSQSAVNPFLLTADKERAILQKHETHKERLTVPRRPYWTKETTRDQLHRQEQDAFLTWRRGLAQLEDTEGLLLTPFERNLEVWKQLWRVIERSSLIVQIVDARHPLFFRSTDLEKYVKEVDPNKVNLLLVNKADMLTENQRAHWAAYFEKNNIPFTFFSAKKAAEEEVDSEVFGVDDQTLPATHVYSAHELITRLKNRCPVHHTAPASNGSTAKGEHRFTIGLVGYPNVGKSSTINALLGAKKVAVGATPGKTKHFQTLFLDNETLLCDCPGLVFPSFATTAAEMVCNGVLPIDQLREYRGPAGLVAQRIPKWVLEATYGITIHIRPLEEGGTGVPTADELLVAYAVARGFTRSGQGNPDESRAARYILKDYVNGKLLYNQPPPTGLNDEPVSSETFNQELYDPHMLAEKTQHLVELPNGEYMIKAAASQRQKATAVTSTKVVSLDTKFFNSGQDLAHAPKTTGKFSTGTFTRNQLYPHHQRVGNDGRVLNSVSTLSGTANPGQGKKHHKKGKKNIKQRSGKGYDDF
ncbi:hypothetical protein IWQ61_003376 [Dispira simplex]|nr:hypothetical protein IWQ61_003376 [Dispira simplex]